MLLFIALIRDVVRFSSLKLLIMNLGFEKDLERVRRRQRLLKKQRQGKKGDHFLCVNEVRVYVTLTFSCLTSNLLFCFPIKICCHDITQSWVYLSLKDEDF